MIRSKNSEILSICEVFYMSFFYFLDIVFDPERDFYFKKEQALCGIVLVN